MFHFFEVARLGDLENVLLFKLLPDGVTVTHISFSECLRFDDMITVSRVIHELKLFLNLGSFFKV